MLVASVLWDTTGTAATFAPAVGPLAIGAVAMGLGGLIRALVAAPRIRREAPRSRAQGCGADRPAVRRGLPSGLYSSTHLAGVAAGTVVPIGSAPLVSALIERVVGERLPLPGWAGSALVVGRLAVLTMPNRTTARPRATTTGTSGASWTDTAAPAGHAGTPWTQGSRVGPGGPGETPGVDRETVPASVTWAGGGWPRVPTALSAPRSWSAGRR
ncbi:hypothetical protein ACH4VX_09310 [Streptomyces sp. NPDC020731]|uniref:hypothetical protein n=1 Tax=Streptomyces sp. NPDC020731 TaxID=3365085 RepID=UPI0037885962